MSSDTLPHPVALSFLLTIIPFSVILLLALKKRKNSPYHSSFFLSSLDKHLFRDQVPLFTDASISTNTMIRKNSLFCKLIRIKFSSKVLFDSYMASFRPELETCPICGSMGNCRIHAYYGRRIVDFTQGQPVCHDICILRLICSCGHTHAVLPDLIVPYSSYGLFFILRVLAEFFSGLASVEKLCERFSITGNQFYKWLKLWKTHRELWLGALGSMEIPDSAFIRILVLKNPYSDFAAAFFSRFSFSFLQSHKNPALYCPQAFGP